MRIRHGVDELTLLYKGNSFDFGGKSGYLPGQPQRSLFILLVIQIFLIIRASMLYWYKEQSFCFLIIVFISSLICIDYYKVPIDYTAHISILMLTIPLGSFLAFIFMIDKKVFDKSRVNFLILAGLFSCLQFAFALGTHDDLWLKSFKLCFFLILAPLPLVSL